MTYQSESSSRCEAIWNTRDGVTPFMIREVELEAEVESRSIHAGQAAAELGGMMVHRGGDVCAPQHTPAIGTRIFVDATIEDLVEGYASAWQRYVGEGGKLDPEFASRWPGKTFREIVHATAVEELGRHESAPPCVVIVTKARQEALILQRGERIAEALGKGWAPATEAGVKRGGRYA